MYSTHPAGKMGADKTSTVRFYGWEENKREIEMDMREMVDKVKRGEPLYGKSTLTPYMQGVASRNSRYTGIWLHLVPWFNFVNHEQVRIVFRLHGLSQIHANGAVAWYRYREVLSTGRKRVGSGADWKVVICNPRCRRQGLEAF